MRDIREDLQERLELVKQQINAEQNRFEKLHQTIVKRAGQQGSLRQGRA